MATLPQWVAGARPRTLPSAVAPVAVGTGSAHSLGSADLGLALMALVVALSLQVGVNYANDYSDGVRGTDSDDLRVGPMRLVGSGLADPSNVKAAAIGCFVLAGFIGFGLATLSRSWWLLLVGALAIVAAWRYTGGERPYGYRGLGEVAVFVFFGLVAVLGTTWTQAHAWDGATWAGAVGVGLLSCALLMVNNIRDIPGDSQIGKRTLAVRLGDRAARLVHLAMLAVAFVAVAIAAVVHPWALLALGALPLAIPALRPVLAGARGAALIPALGRTGALLVGYSALLTLGLALSG